MADLKYYDVILKPVITEKSMNAMADKTYVFLVHPDANKTMIKDPKKLAQRMSILCILIGFIALAVGIIAMAMEQYIIAIAMGIVTVGQVWNYNKWKRVR